MKKARLAGAMAVVMLICAVFGFSFNALAQDFTPTTPIEYHDIGNALFRSTSLSTGSNPYNFNDNWKYYYWCDFTPQYSAEYSASIDAIRPIGVEIYDAEGNLLNADEDHDYGDEKWYYANAGAFLEKGETYYFRLFFCGGHYDSCGKFNIILESKGSPDFPSAENLNLYVGGSQFQTQYELAEYSYQRVFYDISLLLVFADGSFFKWENSPDVSLSVRGVDIILDMSDCAATVGTHKVTIHYMGYEATASFEIVKCFHEYDASEVKPTWLSPGYASHICKKCGESYNSNYTYSGQMLYFEFDKYINAFYGGDGYLSCADMNDDGVINLRDYSLLRELYSDAQNGFLSFFGTSKGSNNYSAEYDMNSDGYINIRDYSLLRQTKPKE